ncbi:MULTISPECIES: DUF3618 domain-containing protein [unclassified Streptomyces]|uniref:DUF3618 domain-containing protein n=1 Tax=Streptomyces evansiae TaxID=3075535 RepID=A0ABD5ED28_9ACTN|nr:MULTISPECIES: DUF3618 domain-containing protein [unclassified Streptomyces]MYR27758.1 DUF3618 domain-containing protein [Streptomyces sp. SID4945]MYX24743.1 DUF3618 domain-containing protein [Streptomyces sp. SID8380]ASY33070.1 hypothetical protein CAC01_10520 [Streptomyces sp. CLI2509]MDT0419365.1 DUF3618 domain-containing protein [Streptomyces sp. DSM 41982]MDT0424689.1 DUF3618 domain-containing protein [Streptomyces sp. DSM 41859]
MSEADARTPAEIEADIRRRRVLLAETLDEIGVRVHPKTIVGDAKAKATAKVDQTLGRAYVGVNRTLGGVRAKFVDEEGSPRLERIVPVALLAVGVVGLVVVSGRRSGKR